MRKKKSKKKRLPLFMVKYYIPLRGINTMISDEEKQLLERIQQKDEKAITYLYRQYSKVLTKYFLRRFKDYEVAEELMQDVFFDFIESLHLFRQESSIKTFLFSIARNKFIDQIRKKKIKTIVFSLFPPHIVEGLKTVLFDQELERKEVEEKIRKTFDQLPSDYQLILKLKYLEGERVKKIAGRLAIGLKAAESLLFRARQEFIKIYKALP